jgi:hypothetical protein
MQNEWILYEIKFLEYDDEENVVERMFEDEIKVHLIIVQFLTHVQSSRETLTTRTSHWYIHTSRKIHKF